PSIYHLTSYPSYYSLFFFTATPPTNIYTLSLHDALPISFNILSNQDTNNDQSNQTDRPSVLSDGTLCVPGATGCTPLITNGVFSTGSLGRNMGITHRFMSLDMRLSRAVRIGERMRLDIIAE